MYFSKSKDFFKSLLDKSNNRPINPFPRSIFEMTTGISHKDQYLLLKDNLLNDNTFYQLTNPFLLKGYLLLNAFREMYDFETYLTKTEIGLMLDMDYCYCKDYRNTIQVIYQSFQSWIYRSDFDKDDIHLLHGLHLDLIYDSPVNHAILVIPFTGESSEMNICKMIIHSPDYLEVRKTY